MQVVSWIEALQSDQEGVDGEDHPEGDDDVGDEEAGVEVGADAGGEREGGVKRGTVGVGGGGDAGEEAQAEGVSGEQQDEGEQGEREAAGPVVHAEEVHGAGGKPVHEGRLVEEADAVDGGGDDVVALEHLARDLEVDGVDVVEQAGSEEAADVEDEPGEDNKANRARVPAECAEWWSCGLYFDLGHVSDALLISHYGRSTSHGLRDGTVQNMGHPFGVICPAGGR